MKRLPRVALVIVALSIIAMLLTWVAGIQLARFGAALALLWFLPGCAWALALDGDWTERGATGLGLAFVASGLATLLLYLIPGAFPIHLARFVYLALVIIPVVWIVRPGQNDLSIPKPRLSRFALLVIVIVAGAARFVNLGYSEFQGDEAVIMRRAAYMLAGDEDELFLHQKGPVEILTPMALWALTGTLNEWQARAPFAVMGVLAAAVVACLATQWFGAQAGLCAGLLSAISGFLVAFGRIVQYQNFVVTMGALGLLLLTAYARRGRLRDLLVGVFFVAYGLLAHYDTVLIAPAALWLLGGAIVTRRDVWRREVSYILAAMLVGLVVLGLFYVPFVLNPMFDRTFTYLSAGRLGGDGLFHNSTANMWVMSTFYNALYYVLGLVLLIGIGLARKAQCVVAWLYFGIPFVFYTFVVIDPRTHIYTFYPSAAVLAGATLASLWQGICPAHRRWALAGAVVAGVWYGVCAGYVYVAYINHQPEYKREWPASRVALYPATFDVLPLYGHFGFPYRAGWKAVEALFAQGAFKGTYASNEEPEVTTWYVHSAARTMCDNPDYYIVAANVQDVIDIDWGELERDYALVAQVTVAGQPKIAIYQRPPLAGDILTTTVEDVSHVFDAQTTFARQAPTPYQGAYPVDVAFGDVGRLSGYDVSPSPVRQGESLNVILYWEALSPPAFNYQVFTHLVVDGVLVAQHDGAPACARRPTSHWEPGEVVRDEHVILIPESVLPGSSTLYAGMYDLLTLVPLPAGDSGDTAVALNTIEVLVSENGE